MKEKAYQKYIKIYNPFVNKEKGAYVFNNKKLH